MTSPFLPSPAEAQAAREHLGQLEKLPPKLAEVLRQLLTPLADGRPVQVLSVEQEITTQQAADLLRVSRPYVVKLLETGQLPCRKVGPRRRIHLEDVLAYKAKLDTQRQHALKALADDLQDLGL